MLPFSTLQIQQCQHSDNRWRGSLEVLVRSVVFAFLGLELGRESPLEFSDTCVGESTLARQGAPLCLVVPQESGLRCGVVLGGISLRRVQCVRIPCTPPSEPSRNPSRDP